MKIGALTLAFRERDFIKANIKQFDGVDIHHLVVCSNTAWHGDYQRDRTYEFARHAGADVVIQNFGADAQQRNYGLRHLAREGCDWALVVDADEFYTKRNIYKLIDCLDDQYDVITAPRMSVYWKTPEYRIIPDPQPDNPIVAIKTDKEFSWSRLSDEKNRTTTSAHFHHLSYVRSDKEMKIKMGVSEHVGEWIEGWYPNVWEAWTPESENLHPVVPSQFQKTIIRPVPDEIMELL
jgi:hypothetical protein